MSSPDGGHRSQVDFEPGFFRDGVDGTTAFDDANVEARPGVRGRVVGGDAGCGGSGRMDGIEDAEVVPGVATRATEGDPEAAAGGGFVDDRGPHAHVHGDEGADAARPFACEEGAHATQVARAFFTDSGDKQQRRGGGGAGSVKGFGKTGDSGQSRGAVADAGTVVLAPGHDLAAEVAVFARAPHTDVLVNRKDGVKVRRDGQQGSIRRAWPEGDDIARLVDARPEPGVPPEGCDQFRTALLVEGRG